ncbi:MAG: hypothetical protein KIG59_03145, partial [Muribaculaceae bacterium]|nr:hypothetical protein [Muribaculaceae bacterium]
FVALAVISVLLLLMISPKCVLAMPIIAGVAGGKHVEDEPLTLSAATEASPGLLINEIDKRIVKIRPMATPIDQLSRWAGAKKSGSMVVDYYSVDTRPTQAKTTDDYEGIDDNPSLNISQRLVRLTLDDASAFEPSETILIKGISGYMDDRTTRGVLDLVLYVESKNSNVLTCSAVNGLEKSGVVFSPSIPSGTTVVRMGRAATELDVQTAQFEALPVKSQNFCQIFKMQIEQSTLQKIANKEVGWTFTDQEEAAVYDMRQGMEKNFLFGVKGRVYDNEKKEEVLLTGGIWRQAGGEFKYVSGALNDDVLVSMMRQAFTGNAGSRRKVLIAGSGLIEQLNRLETTRVVMASENVVKWGI